MGSEHLLVRVGQPDLSGRRSGLAFVKAVRQRVDSQRPGAQGNGSGRYDYDVLALATHEGDVGAYPFKPVALQVSRGAIDEQRRTDFQDATLRLRQTFGILPVRVHRSPRETVSATRRAGYVGVRMGAPRATAIAPLRTTVDIRARAEISVTKRSI